MEGSRSVSEALPECVPAMLRVATALVGSADAEDAVQEAIVRAWQAWPSLRNQQAALPWMVQITVNVCRQWRRGSFGRRQRSESELLPQVEIATFADDPGASDNAAALDLRSAINHLSEDLRLVVVLRYYGGLDSTAIGQSLELPPATVRTRLRRALALLREA